MTHKKIHIVIAVDYNYWLQLQPLLDSLFHNFSGVAPYPELVCIKVLTMGCKIEDYPDKRIEFASCELSDLKSYRTDWPKNRGRAFYACAEGGEFLNYFRFADDDIILHIDADMVMQRPFSFDEMMRMISLKHGEVGGSHHAHPPMTLSQEWDRLLPNFKYSDEIPEYLAQCNKPLFCAALVVCTARTYREIIAPNYFACVPQMIRWFDHHAAGQWIMNHVVYKHGTYVDLGPVFHNAEWYVGKTSIVDQKLVCDGEVVLFNHTKFNSPSTGGKWKFEK